MIVEVVTTIDRPLEAVFRWYAYDHARNHPRWDPDIEIDDVSGEPLHVGSVIRRRSVRYGKPVEGTIEVVELEADRSMGTIIREGGFEMRGGAKFTSLGPDRTEVRIWVDLPENLDAERVRNLMLRSAANIKALAEGDL